MWRRRHENEGRAGGVTMPKTRDLGYLPPIRDVVTWLEGQKESIAAPPESVRLINEILKKLNDALTLAEHPQLDEGLSVEEYAKLTGMSEHAIYKRVKRGQLSARKIGRAIRIPVEPAA